MGLEVRVETVWVGKWGVVKTVIVRQAKKLEDLAVQYFNRVCCTDLHRYVCIPGTPHGGGLNPNYAAFGVESEAWRLAIQEYLVK